MSSEPAEMLTLACMLALLVWAGGLAWCDWRHRRLPNWLTLGGFGVILIARLGYGGAPSLLDGAGAGLIAGGFLLVPFLLGVAGGGDVKMLLGAGAGVGWQAVLSLLWYTSLCGLVLGVGMMVVGRLSPARLQHWARVLVDWRYDRKAGAVGLPGKADDRVCVPFGVAIFLGLVGTMLLSRG